MSGSTFTIQTADGSFDGYLARPGVDGNGPGVIVIQEIFGVNTGMRELCDALAREGFVALCPDLFWRIEPGICLTDHSEAEMARAFELYGAVDVDQAVDDIATSIGALRGHEACANGKVGAVGYCLGGLLAYLIAARTDVDAAVGYYGVSIQERLREADRMEAPLMLHIAEEDQFVPKEAQGQIIEALGHRAQVALHQYPGQEHAFARPGGQHYDAASADLANERTRTFLREHLGA